MKVRIKESLEVLRPSRRFASKTCSPDKTQPQPASIELARTEFLKNANSKTNISRSLTLLTREKRQKKDFRTSLRSSASDEVQDSVDLAAATLHKARSLSASLRARFQKTFHKSPATLPPQQLDASRAHFGNDFFENTGNGGFDTYSPAAVESDGKRTSLYASQVVEQNTVEDFERLSRISHVNMSNGSFTSNSGSRVTSWTNSTNTGSMRELPLERKRLSVIQEDGSPHQPSCSAGTHLGGVSIFRTPIDGYMPDSQRLYSALTRRMHQESVEAQRLATIRQQEEEEDEPTGKYITQLGPDLSIRHVQDERDDSATLNGNTKNFPDDNSWKNQAEVLSKKTVEKLRDDMEGVWADSTSYSAHNLTSKHKVTPADSSNIKHSTMFGQDADQNSFQHQQNMSGNNHHLRNGHSFALSSESIYSTTTNGGANPDFERRIFSGTSAANLLPTSIEDGHVAVPNENLPVPDKDPAQSSKLDYTYKQHSNLQHVDADVPRVRSSNENWHDSTHFREKAQIENEAPSLPRKALDELTNRALGVTRKPSLCDRSQGSRTPTPSSQVPDQLSIAKKRFPLLNVKQVSRNNTPIPSRSSSLTRSQSGLLQQISSKEKHGGKDLVEYENKLTASLRKISPENVANLLRGKRSLPAIPTQKQERQENRPSTTESPEAASTPGPAYIRTRTGNNLAKLSQVEQAVDGESPTNLVKATLSARLSRPFNMDTPELNRPFDSMYLGKREVGFADTAGARLSVANKSIDVRGPNGYGGLGPPPIGTPKRFDRETALPHFPTPEDDAKKQHNFVKGAVTLGIGSKRMVSNFLRSRRKGGSSDKENQPGSDQGQSGSQVDEGVEGKDSLFI